MQQVINAKERNQAFAQYLVFFVITVCLVTAAIYFNYRVPIAHNKFLNNQIELQRSQDIQQEKFVTHLREAEALTDSLDRKGSNTRYVEMMLNQKIMDLSKLRNDSSSLYGQLDNALIQAFTKHRDVKIELINLQQEREELQQEIKKLKEELNNAQSQPNFGGIGISTN